MIAVRTGVKMCEKLERGKAGRQMNAMMNVEEGRGWTSAGPCQVGVSLNG